MLTFIIGPKGSGKTIRFIEAANKCVDTCKGNIVCIEKGMENTYILKMNIKVIDVVEYDIKNYDDLYYFLMGLCARDYDTMDIFIDGTMRIGGKNMEDLKVFLKKVKEFGEKHNINFTLTLSADMNTLGYEIATIADKLM